METFFLLSPELQIKPALNPETKTHNHKQELQMQNKRLVIAAAQVAMCVELAVADLTHHHPSYYTGFRA